MNDIVKNNIDDFGLKNEIKALIEKLGGVVSITFTKKDGTERVLLCSLTPPENVVVEEKKTERTKKENPNVLSVWDLENNGWRSCSLDSIKNISYHKE